MRLLPPDRSPVPRSWPLVAASLLVLVGFLSAGGALANPDVQQKRTQADAILGQIAGLDAQVEAAAERWNGANYRLGRLDRELSATRADLARARANLRRARLAASRRVVELYEENAPSTLDLLLGSGSFGEAMDALEMRNRVSDQDAEIAGRARMYRLRVASRERRIAEARAEQAHLVERLATQKAAIERTLADRQRLLASVRTEIQWLEEQEAARQAELRRRAAAELRRQEERTATAPAGDSGSATPQVPEATAASASTASPAPPDSRGTAVVAIAMRYLGIPYMWGGASPSTGFDCSGLTMYVYAQVGVSLPHYAAAQYGMGVSVARSQLQPGDLVFFNGLSHMGMYIGGGNFIHAPRTGDVVKISSLSEAYYTASWVGARRVL